MKTRKAQFSRRNQENGFLLVLLAVLLVPLAMYVSLLIFWNRSNLLAANLKRIAENAASSGAAAFCSTNACYENAVRLARKSISDQLPSLGLDMSEIQIEIQRGRFWPKGSLHGVLRGPGLNFSISGRDRTLMTDMISFHPRFVGFEPFEGEGAPAGGWQNTPPNLGTPNFIVANAIRVSVELPHLTPLFRFFGSARPGRRGEAIASANGFPDGAEFETNVAPFAIPACALVDGNGDFNPTTTCLLDRYFVQADRYCGGKSDCNVVLGSFWSPLSERQYCNPELPWYNLEMCECARNPDSKWAVGDIPCNQIMGGQAISCQFNRWAVLDRVSNIYGVVGLPQGMKDILNYDGAPRFTQDDADDPKEQHFQNAFKFWDRTYLHTFIGDRFFVRGNGLTLPQTDALLWAKVRGAAGSSGAGVYDWDSERGRASINFPLQFSEDSNEQIEGGTEVKDTLGYDWLAARVKNSSSFPLPGSVIRRWLDKLESPGKVTANGVATPVIAPPLPTVSGPQCLLNLQIKAPPGEPAQYGTCNSHRAWYDNRCSEYWGWYLYPIETREEFKKLTNRTGINAYPVNWPVPPAPPWKQGQPPPPGWKLVNNDYWQATRRSVPGIVPFNWPDEWLPGGRVMPDSRLFNYGNPTFPASGTKKSTGENWVDFYEVQAGDPFNCDQAPIYTACPAIDEDCVRAVPTGYGTLVFELAGGPCFSDENGLLPWRNPRNTRVWRAKVPVIADMEATRPCQGAGARNNPPIDPTHEWRIVGFLIVYLFDSDIGAPPPKPPGSYWETQQAVIDHPGMGHPSTPVCDYSDHQPWGFNPTGAGEQNCNMVRGRVSCSTELISGFYFDRRRLMDGTRIASVPRPRPMIVY